MWNAVCVAVSISCHAEGIISDTGAFVPSTTLNYASCSDSQPPCTMQAVPPAASCQSPTPWHMATRGWGLGLWWHPCKQACKGPCKGPCSMGDPLRHPPTCSCERGVLHGTFAAESTLGSPLLARGRRANKLVDVPVLIGAAWCFKSAAIRPGRAACLALLVG